MILIWIQVDGYKTCTKRSIVQCHAHAYERNITQHLNEMKWIQENIYGGTNNKRNRSHW